MNKLKIWYYKPSSRPKGVPEWSNTTITDQFNNKKPMPDFDYPWLRYNHYKMPFPPDDEKLRLPKSLFFVVKKEKEVLFDFFSWNTEYKVISEEMLIFFQDYGLTEGYEIAKSSIVSTKGKELTAKKYFIIRISRFNEHLIDFNPETMQESSRIKNTFLFPDMKPKTGITQKVFFLKENCYKDTLLLDDRLTDEVCTKFYQPELYDPNDYISVYDQKRW